jgi:uncharacterized protein YndB with AHSA1/START domain
VTDDDVISASVRIAATPDKVFPYFTDATLLREWLGQWASLEPVPGGVFSVDFERVPVRGTYVTVEPPHRVVFTWGIAGNDGLPPGSSTVEITLRAVDEDTVVELVHRGLPEARRADHRAGWTLRLDALAAAAP